MEQRATVVAVVGPSGSGKTTLLEHLLPELEARGLRVAAVKHASHGFEADRPGKDSHRLFQSGARAVALVSPERTATFVRRPVRGRPRLGEALEALPSPLDLVLVEGFSWEPVPRIAVVSDSGEPKPDDLAGGEVIDVVAAPRVPLGGRPLYDEAVVKRLARSLELRTRAERRLRSLPAERSPRAPQRDAAAPPGERAAAAGGGT